VYIYIYIAIASLGKTGSTAVFMIIEGFFCLYLAIKLYILKNSDTSLKRQQSTCLSLYS